MHDPNRAVSVHQAARVLDFREYGYAVDLAVVVLIDASENRSGRRRPWPTSHEAPWLSFRWRRSVRGDDCSSARSRTDVRQSQDQFLSPLRWHASGRAVYFRQDRAWSDINPSPAPASP